MTAFLRARASGRHVLFCFVFVAILSLLIQFAILPVYHRYSAGFDPMNIQVPLSWTMVAVQRGAYAPGLPIVHVEYAAAEMFLLANRALFLALLWCWLAARAPGSLADRLVSRGFLFLPPLALALGIGENACFLKLLFANPHDPRQDLTTLTLVVHRAAAAMSMVTKLVTLGLIVLVVLARVRRAPA